MLGSALNGQWAPDGSIPVRPRRSVPIQRVQALQPLLKEYAFYTLAPFYVHGGVNISIPDQFESIYGEKKRLLVEYPRPLFRDLGGWNNLLEGMELGSYTRPEQNLGGEPEETARTAWADFCEYLHTCGFTDLQRRIYWQMHILPLWLETPEVRIVSSQSPRVMVHVVLPEGNWGRLMLREELPVQFYWEKPSVQLVEIAEKAFLMKQQGGLG